MRIPPTLLHRAGVAMLMSSTTCQVLATVPVRRVLVVVTLVYRFLVMFHYQVGIYNGEGVNETDKDNRKDIIGGFWVMPIKGLRVGAFGWTGSRGNMTVDYAKDANGNYILDSKGNKTAITGSVAKNRYAFSAEYSQGEYMFRAEYLHSQGWGAAKAGNNTREVDYSKGDKADGWYAFGIVPVIKGKLHAKARYQCYRAQKEWDSAKTSYEADRSLAGKHDYNLVDLEMDFRF